jgi:hypothetical protein
VLGQYGKEKIGFVWVRFRFRCSGDKASMFIGVFLGFLDNLGFSLFETMKL